MHQITVPVSGVETFCSVGLASDGSSLYYDRCGDPHIYRIDPLSGALQSTFDPGIAENPNCLAYDATRNGMWIGAQRCDAAGMPIHFWRFDDNSVTRVFTIPIDLINPATGQRFLFECFCDGLTFQAQDLLNPNDDELWFNDDINRNIAVLHLDGSLVRGLDTVSVDPLVRFTSGLAIGGTKLFLGNNGGGDIFRADVRTNPLARIDQFTSGNNRIADLECDPVTFAPKEVMWARTTPQGGLFPDVITAFEIEPNTCVAPGGATTPCELTRAITVVAQVLLGRGNPDLDLVAAILEVGISIEEKIASGLEPGDPAALPLSRARSLEQFALQQVHFAGQIRNPGSRAVFLRSVGSLIGLSLSSLASACAQI